MGNDYIIDLNNPCITAKEATIICDMIAKKDQYVSQGRMKEAHGARQVIQIFWNSVIGFEDTIPSSKWTNL